MCRSCGLRHNSVVTDISPGGQGNDGSLNSISSAGFTHAWRNIGSGVSSMGGIEPCFGGGVVVPGGGPGSGRCGGVGTESGGNRSAGLTMKEYDQHLARLNKENFALKLRIYFLEEKQGQTGQAAPQLHKANIELKVENESLKRQLFDKQQLLSQASSALVQLEEEYKEQLAALLREHETRVRDLQDNVLQLQKTADEYADRCQELESNLREQQQQISRKPDAGINELTHLCDLAFPTTEDAAADETATGNNCWSNAALWTNNSSDTAMLWGLPTTVPSAGLLAAGAPITTTDAVSTAGSQDTASHVQGKLSSESQNSQNGFSDNRGAPATADANSPIHVNTTNVTNNNINNTLPNTSNKLQQMQYHHPSQYQQQNASSKAYPEQHQQHYHYYQQQQPVTNALVAAGATVNDASNVLATAQQLPNIGDASAVVPAVVSSAVTPPSVQGVLSVGGHAEIDESGKQRMQELEQNIAQLGHKLQLLQEQLRHKDNITDALQEDLENLKKELQEKESEALEREEKVESLSQELETRHLQLRTKEDTIHNLHSDLDRVEPEISLKVQEIVERDRIIEEKIEQIDQQNKILVEIQITLDEKQKQIAELEASLAEARDRATQLEKDYNRSCGALNGFISDLSLRDKDIVNLKKEVKKRDRKIKDLVAELKETLDMLGKAKWEAETSGCGEDSVKEMVEEENERLWAEMEQKKSEVQSLRDQLSRSVENAGQQSAELGQCQETLRQKEEAEKRWKEEIESLSTDVRNRETMIHDNKKQVEELKMELTGIKQELKEKMQELTAIKTGNNSGSDSSDHSSQLEKLRHKLEICRSEKAREIDALKGQLELKNSDIVHLQSQLISEAKHAGDVAKNTTELATAGALLPAMLLYDNIEAVRNKTKAAPVHYESVQVSITAGILSTACPVPGAAAGVEQQLEQLKHQRQTSENLNPDIAPNTDPDGMVATQISDGITDENTISKFQRQLENLRSELKDTKYAIGCQMLELGGGRRNYQKIVHKYRSECNRLRKRLGESNNACELLRNRLEELADFLEQILDMDEKGLIDLSKMSGLTRAGLQKSLNDTRDFSQTLSQSLLLGMDTLMEDELQWDEEADITESLLPDCSAYYAPAADVTIASSVGHHTFASIAEVSNLNDTNYHNIASKLCSEVENKAKKLDDILEHLAKMSGDLDRRETEVVKQSDVIIALRKQVKQLEERVEISNSTEQASTCERVETGCQTLLAMPPRQSVSSLHDVSTPYLSSCSDTYSQSNVTMEPLIEDEVLKSTNATELTEEHLGKLLLEETDKSKSALEIQDSNASTLLRSSPSVLTGSGSHVVADLKSTDRSAKSGINTGCVSAGEAATVAQNVPASPSESEAWSEPDRNVSLARIGLETCTLAASIDRSLSRSRQTRAAAALSSESDTEECPALPDDNASLISAVNMTVPLSSVLKSIPKRRSDASEVRRLAAKLRTMEHLNETLKAELNIYQSLSHQLSPTTDQQQSDCRPSLSTTNGINKNNAAHTGTQEQTDSNPLAISAGRVSLPISTTSKKYRRFTSSGEDSLALAAPLLQEIRSLRTKLEESISNNDQLRDQLEAAVLSCSRASDDPSHLTHLTAALLNAQETLQLTREKLAFAERCEQVQTDRCSVAERRTEDEAKVCDEIRAQLRDTQQQVATAVAQVEMTNVKYSKHSDALKLQCNQAEASLQEAKKVHEESEAMLQNRLIEVTKACEESEAQLKEQHKAINEVYASLQETSHWPHLNHLHSALQASETQVLKVTRDRLVLLGEKSKLQARLMSAQAQTSLLSDSLCEEEPMPPLLHQQLAQVQAAVKNLQDQCCRLQSLNASLNKDRERLEEKLAGYKAVEKLVNKSDITLESVSCDGGQRGRSNEAAESRLNNNVAIQQLQINHSLLQQDYTHLQKLYSVMQGEEKRTCEKLHVTNSALQKTQLSIDALNEQYQNKMQTLQKECTEKLLEAEKQVLEVQQRFQDRMNTSENKLSDVQKKNQERLDEMRNRSKDEINRLEVKLHELLQQLHTERRAGQSLRIELRTLQQRSHLDSVTWSDNKENVHGSSHSNSNIPLSKSPNYQTGISSTLKSSNPIPTKGRSGYSPSHMNSPPFSVYQPHSLGASFQAHSLGSNYQHQSLSNSNLSSFVRSPARSLHFSDPNLGIVGSSNIHHTVTEDELDELEELTREAYGSDSPDLGLGSSDNGQMSSLERVMGHTSIRVGRRAATGVEHHNTSIISTSSIGGYTQKNGSQSTEKAISYRHGNQFNMSRCSGDDRGSRSSLHSPKNQSIGVLITERSSLPPVVVTTITSTTAPADHLCVVPGHRSLASSNQDLTQTVESLQEQLACSDARLEQALQQLKAANARKQTVERAICRQLTKTHQVLRKAKGNLQQQTTAARAPNAATDGGNLERQSSVD